MWAIQLNADLPADTSVLEEVGELIAEACRNAGFDDEEISDVALAVDEACTNTIYHGLLSDPDKTFQLAVRTKTNEIEILIHELGRPFDPNQITLPDLTKPLEERPIGGLGIFLIRKLMDEVEFYVDECQGKILRMIKRK